MRDHRIPNFKAAFAISAILLSVACDEDGNEVDPEPTPTECQLESIVESIDGTDGTVTFTYDTDGRPVKLEYVFQNSTSNRSDVIEYDASGNVVKISSEKGYVEYAYNSENKVISTKAYPIIQGSATLSYDVLHYYNNKGQLDSTAWQGTPTPMIYDRFEYDDKGNLIKVFSKTAGPEKLIREYLEFDDKERSVGNNFSRYTFVGFDYIIDLTCLVYPAVSEHNVIRANVRTAGGDWQSISSEFVYNDLGYVTRRTTTGIAVAVYDYNYECK